MIIVKNMNRNAISWWISPQKTNNMQLLFDESKRKYQWPDTIDIQMFEYIKKFDGQDLRLLYKTFKQDGEGEYIDTRKIKTLYFPTWWADKEKTAPLFDWNLFFTGEASKNWKQSTKYWLLSAGKILFERMDKNPDLINEQRMSDLTMLFRKWEGNIMRAIGKNWELNMFCFSEKDVQRIEEIKKVINFQQDLQTKYWWTKDQIQGIIDKHKNITDIEEIITTIETEYQKYWEHWQRSEPTPEYLYEVLMTAEEVQQ